LASASIVKTSLKLILMHAQCEQQYYSDTGACLAGAAAAHYSDITECQQQIGKF
jgi:hypothetical protein